MRYTLAVTSCSRFDLLQATLDSFIDRADIMPEATVIIEDSGEAQPAFLSAPKYKALGRGEWINNGSRRGQIYSLDRLYDAVKTPYVFHCEDDWLFTKGGFLARSFGILENNPSIWTVSLRGNECNGHPNIPDTHNSPGPYLIQQPGWMGGWGGCTFNPGLRRLKDFHRIRSYGAQVGYSMSGCAHELALSKMHLDLGYRIAVLPEVHIKHLGEGKSKAIMPLPERARILLAVPTSLKYDYGTHTSGIKRDTSGRLEAVRDTWMQDAHIFPNVHGRFFNGRDLDCPDDYTRLPEKIKALCQYADKRDYDFLVKADDDTALYVDRLLRSGFDAPGVDQMGYFRCECARLNRKCKDYVTGMCYTLSRRAIRAVANAPLLEPSAFLHWAEDYWVGGVMRENFYTRVNHPGWVSGEHRHYAPLPFPPGTVAAHSVKPEDMRAWYRGVSAL